MGSTIALIWFISFIILFAILYLFDLRKKSEYFAEEQRYVAKLRVIKMFDRYLGRNPSEPEMKKFLKFRDEEKIIERLEMDYPDEFSDRENSTQNENDESDKVNISLSMASDVSRLSNLQNI